jgi:tetratricopeptide (TPR) repeat protein
MDNGIKFSSALLLALSLAGVKAVQAADEPADMPNPFAPVTVHTESKGSKWRHAFHDMKNTLVDKFKVYPEELEGCEPAVYDKIKGDPAFYLDRKVKFDVYFGRIGSFYRPFVSPFNQDSYVNFSAWGYGTELWLKEGRSAIHPLYYIDKRKKELIDSLSHLPMYTPLSVSAEVRSKSDGLPWIEVIGYEVIPETALNADVLRHIEMGAVQSNKKRYDLAINAFEAAIAMEVPLNVETKVYAMLGRAYYEQRSFTSARNALCNAVLRDPRNIEGLILLARSDLRIDKAEEAKQATEAAIAIEPANALAHAELGLALAMLNDNRGGYRELDVAQRLARNQLPEAHRNRAMIALREGKLSVAENELKQAVLFRPTDVELKIELGDVYLTMGKPEDLEKARAEYTQARDLAVSRPEPFYKLAVLLKKQGDMLKKDGKDDAAKKAYEDALENAKNAIQRDDQFTPAYGLQAEILRALGRNEEAQKVLEGGMKIRFNVPRMQEYVYQQAVVLGDWKTMEDSTRFMLARRPTAELYSRLGSALAGKPEPDMNGAAEAFANAVKLAPDSQRDWAALGHIRLNYQGDMVGAQDALRKAVELNKLDGVAQQNLAVASRNLGNTDEAIKAADEAVALTVSPQSRLIAALARIDRGSESDLTAASELANKALADSNTDKDKAWANAVLAAVAVKNGKNDEAIELFTKSDVLMSESAEYNLWYGQALLNAGVSEGALEHLRSAISMTQGKVRTSPLAARINADAGKSLRYAEALAKGQPREVKPIEKTPAPETTKIEDPKKVEPTKTSTKKVAPVIEEPDGQQPTPAKVPQPEPKKP